MNLKHIKKQQQQRKNHPQQIFLKHRGKNRFPQRNISQTKELTFQQQKMTKNFSPERKHVAISNFIPSQKTIPMKRNVSLSVVSDSLQPHGL